MTKYLSAFVGLFLLAACSPVSLYYKEGEVVSRQKSDMLSCEVEALDKAPVANQIRQSPPYYVPARRSCRSDGRCYTRGGFFAPGEVYSVDVNARLRRDLLTQCMAQKGYARVTLPRCSGSVTLQPAASSRARVPAVTPQSCAAKDSTGTWQISEQKS